MSPMSMSDLFHFFDANDLVVGCLKVGGVQNNLNHKDYMTNIASKPSKDCEVSQ